MSQWPRWARKQMLEQKLSNVLNNPYADQADVVAARKAVQVKLDQQDEEFQNQQSNKTAEYLRRLNELG